MDILVYYGPVLTECKQVVPDVKNSRPLYLLQSLANYRPEDKINKVS